LQHNESGWWTGENNGRMGLFPSNYVKVIAAGYEEEVTALFDYSPPEIDSRFLSLKKGEGFFVLNKVTETGWWYVVSKNGKFGLIPSNYVTI